VKAPASASPDEQRRKALDLAAHYVDRRDRTVAELRRYLEGKRMVPHAIAAAIDELTACGQLDDSRYAQRFVEDKRQLDHWGSDRIERRLQALGVEHELVAAALAVDSGDELSRAVELLQRRYPTPLIDNRERARALGVLVRRGYELELAHDAIRAHGRSRVA
jgi:regulatory protein